MDHDLLGRYYLRQHIRYSWLCGRRVLGRLVQAPCYHHLHDNRRCSYLWRWTFERDLQSILGCAIMVLQFSRLVMRHDVLTVLSRYNPGAFQNGFKGFCAVFVTAAFSFAGTELVGLAAAEANNPTKSLPSAIKQVFWRITLFYILGLTLVGLLVSSTDPRLLNAANPYADGTSPFVLAGKDAGLAGFDSFMNVVILVSVLSLGVSCVYGGSRTLTALAEQGYAPKIFAYIDRSGRPLPSVAFCLAFGALAYIVLASSGQTVFNWLLALSGLAALFTWGSICYVSLSLMPLIASLTRLSIGPYSIPTSMETPRPHRR